MRDITFQNCVEFQDCFLFDGKFSPFEMVGDFRTYYPRVLIGEIGGLLNLSCKVVRSAKMYDEEIRSECADIFIYLLLFGRMLEIHDQKQVFGLIAKHWNDHTAIMLTEEDYYKLCEDMIEKVLRFLKPEKESYYNESYFYEIFSSIRQASNFITKLNWQHIINKFHQDVIQTHTIPTLFTLDGLYRGSFRINIDSLLHFASKVGIELPEKRVDFLKRMKVAQSAFWSSPSLENGVKMATTV
jgi:hypothetical protein